MFDVEWPKNHPNLKPAIDAERRSRHLDGCPDKRIDAEAYLPLRRVAAA